MKGIEKGYVNDRVVGIMRDEGVREEIVDMGEYRDIGGKKDGKKWSIGIEDIEEGEEKEEFIEIMDKEIEK